jgi:hypothetical protein
VACDGVALAFEMLVNGRRGDCLQALRRTTVDRARFPCESVEGGDVLFVESL